MKAALKGSLQEVYLLDLGIEELLSEQPVSMSYGGHLGRIAWSLMLLGSHGRQSWKTPGRHRDFC